MIRLKLTLFLVLFFNSFILSAQVVTIWGGEFDENGSFDGGLNEWTTEGISSNDPDSIDNALWAWASNGKADEGSFWGDREGIDSPSKANGAAVFDSDFLDTRGNAMNPDGTFNPDALGSGSAPAPHTSVLVSPVIDCSAYPEVTLLFYQYYRNHISTCNVGVSDDNGATWTDIPVNQGIGNNEESVNGEKVTLDITDIAAGSDSVRIRFTFEGNNYFWIIDDVSLLSFGEFDLAIGNYSRYPLKNMNTPVCILEDEELHFETEVTNNGLSDQQDVVVRVEVLFENSSVVWSDIVELDRLSALTKDSLVIFPESFTFDHTVGSYEIKYEIFSLSQPDQVLSNNQRRMKFEVTYDLWSKDSGEFLNTDNIPDSINRKSVALIFETPTNLDFSCPQNSDVYLYFENTMPDIRVEAEVHIFDLPEEVDQDYSNLNEVLGDVFVFPFQSDQVFYKVVELIGYSDFESVIIKEDEFYDWFSFENASLRFKPDSRYMLTLSIVDSKYADIALSPTEEYSEPVCFSYEEDSTGFTPFVSDMMPVVRIGRPITTSVTEQIRPKDINSGIEINPNPVKGEVSIDHFSLDQDCRIQIFDLRGALCYSKDLDESDSSPILVDTSRFDSGTYVVTIISSQGVFSERIVVVD